MAQEGTPATMQEPSSHPPSVTEDQATDKPRSYAVLQTPTRTRHVAVPVVWPLKSQPDDTCRKFRADDGAPGIDPTKASEPVLDPGQAAVVDMIVRGRKNVFFTGSAGSGKSLVLKSAVKSLRGLGLTVEVVAPTGRAALEVDGSTLYSFAGWNPGVASLPMHKVLALPQSEWTLKRLRDTDVLVIDEISMVDSSTLDRLNILMKTKRGNSRLPFGGAQVVVCGDFFQLPPVKPFEYCVCCGRELIQDWISPNKFHCPRDKPIRWPNDLPCQVGGFYMEEDKWAFRSRAWQECQFEHVELKTVHRQHDENYLRLLEKCRLGIGYAEEEVDLFANHPSFTDGASKIFSTRKEVARVNETEYNKLKTKEYIFPCSDFVDPRIDDPDIIRFEQRLKDHKYKELLGLKKGMIVVLVSNISPNNGLVNGSQGVICGFAVASEHSLEYGYGVNVQHNKIKQDQIKKFYERMPDKVWPIVKFYNGETRTIQAECTVIEYSYPEIQDMVQISRTQIPLTAGWAITVHRAQGMTLDRAIVDLSKVFERGQIYVAFSRTRTLEGLKVEGDMKRLRAPLRPDEAVRKFYEKHFGTRYAVNQAINGKGKDGEEEVGRHKQ